MINSIYKVATEIKDKVNNIVEYQKVLKECTSNENWNIANTKLQVLADHSYNWNDYTVIMKHLWTKLNSNPREWRRIFKSLHAMEYLIKNGAPRVVQEIKDDLFKIRALQDFSYKENGTDKGQGIRDKSRSICELLSDPNKLQEEREFARKTREKFTGISSSGATSGGQSYQGGSHSTSAAPASGKYGGFGSEDIHKMGYKEGQFNQPYDPYAKSYNATEKTEEVNKKKHHHHQEKEEPEKKKHKKHKKKDDSDDDDSEKDSSEDSDSDSDSEAEKKKKKKKKKGKKQEEKKDASQKLGQAPKATRAIDEQKKQPVAAATQQQPQQDLMDLLSTPSTNTAPTNTSSGFNFFDTEQQQIHQQPAAQQNGLTDIFSSMSINQPAQQTQQTQQNNMFANMNVGGQTFPQQQQQPMTQQQQPNTGMVFGSPTQPQMQQQPFGYQQPQQQQQQQQQSNPNMGFAHSPFGMPQQQQQQQPNTMFSNMNMAQPSPQKQDMFGNFQTAPTGQNSQQFGQPIQAPKQTTQTNAPAQNQAWQPKNQNKWDDGAGLFDLNNLKSGDKNILESSKPKGSHDLGANLLLTKDADLDQLWTGAIKSNTTPTSQNLGYQGYQGQQNKFVPNINPTQFYQQQQQQQQPQMYPGMNQQMNNQRAGQTGFGAQGAGFQQQHQQQPSMYPGGGIGGMGSGLQFQPPQFYGQQQQQQPMGNMMGQQQQQPMGGNQGFGQFSSATGGNTMGNQQFGGSSQGSGGFNFM